MQSHFTCTIATMHLLVNTFKRCCYKIIKHVPGCPWPITCNGTSYLNLMRSNPLYRTVILSYFILFIYLNLFIYIFIFGCLGSWLLCVGFVQLRERELRFVAVSGLLIAVASLCCGAQIIDVWASVVVACRLQSTGSVVVAHGFSCSAACGIFQDQGSNQCPLYWQADS